MILQALCRCYDVMAADDNFNIVPMGYSKVGCSWAIKLRADGTAAASGPIPLSDEKSGQMLTVPLQPGRSGKNPAPYILCDKSKYFLGAEIPTGGKELVATPASLENSLKRHQEVFSDVEDDGAKAVLRFLERMRNGEQLDIAPDHSIYKSGNIVFRLSGERGYIHERPAVKQAWERYLDKQSSEDPDSLYGECLITGEKDVKIAHPYHVQENSRQQYDRCQHRKLQFQVCRILW